MLHVACAEKVPSYAAENNHAHERRYLYLGQHSFDMYGPDLARLKFYSFHQDLDEDATRGSK